MVQTKDDTGLSHEEAKKRLEKYGINEIVAKKNRSGGMIFLMQLKNPLILVLVAASIIALFLGENADAIIILLIVMVNTVMGFFQEFKAEKIVRELRKLLPLEATVMRNGKKFTINARELVPGDRVFLRIGDIVPADVSLLHCDALTIDEASLTGESVPVEKNIDILLATVTLPQDMKNRAFMGSHVMSGYGDGVVVATAHNTFFGKTARFLEEEDGASDFEVSMGAFSSFLLKIVLIMTIFIFGANTFLHHGMLESFLFALALAVGITPESLPIIITISLSKGARLMAASRVIVKKLTSIEDIGNMDVLCTDKTGTLTEGHLSLEKCFNPDGHEEKDLLVWGLLCNDAVVTDERIDGSSIDKAMWESPHKNDVLVPFATYKVLDINEFDFQRRRMSVIAEDQNGKRFLVVKGAVESVEVVTEFIMIKGKKEPFDKAHQDAYHSMINLYRTQGYSTISVAIKEWKDDHSEKTDEKGLTLMGFFIFLDPPRMSARTSLLHMEKLGVAIKVLSGDDPFVTHTICKKVGLVIADNKIYTGDELDKLNDKEFQTVVEKYNVFARITPEHKYRIVKTLNIGPQRTIGFMGDGINDAPALKAADVGISVNTATSIAKEAADIILLEKDLAVLVQGVSEGRKIFANINKYIRNTVSANFGNMFTVAFSSLFMQFIPLLPSQILLNNLITDMPMLTVATDNVDIHTLSKPKKLDIKTISSFMKVFGVLSSVFDLIIIATLLFVLKTDQDTFRSVWFFESALSEIAVTFVLRTQQVFFKSMPARSLIVLSALAALVIVLFMVPSPLNSFFHFAPISSALFAFVIGVVALYCLSAEVVKHFFFKKHPF